MAAGGYSGYSSQAADAGPSVEIVDVLTKLGRPVPIEFLAHQLGRRPGGLMEDLTEQKRACR